MKSVKSSRYYRRKLRSSNQTYSPVKVLTMGMSTKTVMALKSYQNHAGTLVKNYLLSVPFIPYTSILSGMFLCKMVCSYLSLCVELCICIFFSLGGRAHSLEYLYKISSGFLCFDVNIVHVLIYKPVLSVGCFHSL